MRIRTAIVPALAAAIGLGTVLLAGSPAMAGGSPGGPPASTTRPVGAVFVGTNHNNSTDPSQPANQVVMYRRGNDGTLTKAGVFDTGGQGSGPSQRFAGDGLGAGESVRLSEDQRWLFVANAGSNSVSVFRVHPDRLELTDVEPTGDGSAGRRFPNSVAQHDDLVYVLNSADQGSITGFRLTTRGKLVRIPGSTRELAANQQRFTPDPLYDPAQVSFTPDGSRLVVSIKDGPDPALAPGTEATGPGRILTFAVDPSGRPANTFVRTDFGHRGPFGFSFDRRGNLLVGEFVGGPVEDVGGVTSITGAAGSYRINRDGTLTPITPGVPDHQLDTCWLVNNGRYAFGANYSSGTVSSYRVGPNGALTLLNPVAGTTEHPGNVQGSTPLDSRVSPDGTFLYVVLPGSGRVAGWQIRDDGSLRKVGEFGGLPQTVNGDQAPVDFGAGGSPAGIAVI
ncbi:lactonase family protein [Nakamurella sp.]|uniref:lactonase family protein n=1 Tax=Nakamurella sp. TaxID=1869182 RepID=UPI003782E1E1